MYVVLYLVAIVAANLAVTQWGPSVAVICAFLFIGLDLTMRDRLHLAWHRQGLAWKMGLLIGAGSLVSWILNREAERVAMASCIAFACTGLVDTLVFSWLGARRSRRLRRWVVRVNLSNLVSAGVDSLVFPALAFGFPFLWPVMLGQFLAKVTGGAVWCAVITRGRKMVGRRV